MYVDLIKDSTSSINVSEISKDSMHYEVSYSTWRNTIVNMFLPEDQNLFLERTAPEYLKKTLLPGKTASFDCQMKNLEGVFIWVKLIFSRAQTTNEDDFRFVFMVQNIHQQTLPHKWRKGLLFFIVFYLISVRIFSCSIRYQ